MTLTVSTADANMDRLMGYERDNIHRLSPYVPGEQPQRGPVVKLNTNENPYPPSPAVLAAVQAVTAEQLRRYPSPTAAAFRQTAAKVHGLTPQQVIATNGGDELLRLAVTVFCQPRGGDEGGGVIGGVNSGAGGAGSAAGAGGATAGGAGGAGGAGVAEPSYSLYPVLAGIHETPVTAVPLTDAFALPDDLGEQLVAAGCRLVFVVNPHAPSGRLEPVSRLAALAQRLRGQAVLLVDEAYVDFASGDALSLISGAAAMDNVLLLRSLSKGYSLAGLRFGYGLGHGDLIAALDKARDSYNTDVLAQAAAVAALEHRDEASRSWQAVIAQRRRLADELTARRWRVCPSQTNFLLAQPPADGPTAAALHESLKQRDIFVRYFDQDRLRDKLRITVGTPEQNDALLVAVSR